MKFEGRTSSDSIKRNIGSGRIVLFSTIGGAISLAIVSMAAVTGSEVRLWPTEVFRYDMFPGLWPIILLIVAPIIAFKGAVVAACISALAWQRMARYDLRKVTLRVAPVYVGVTSITAFIGANRIAVSLSKGNTVAANAMAAIGIFPLIVLYYAVFAFVCVLVVPRRSSMEGPSDIFDKA